jgi:hypothetical protein
MTRTENRSDKGSIRSQFLAVSFKRYFVILLETNAYFKSKADENNKGRECSAWWREMVPESSDVFAGFRTAFRKRPEKLQRMIILLLLIDFMLYIFVYNGTEGTHRYLFAINKYGWDEQQFTRYLATYRIYYLVTLWFFLPLASRYINVNICLLVYHTPDIL